jgi:hypothetical protein
MDQFRDFLQSAFGFVRSTKESYDTGSRFMKMRVWIVTALALDVLLTLGFVLFSGGRPLDVVVWFEPGFPANMLVVRNEGSYALRNATLVLDGRYTLAVDKIDRGLNGYEVNRAFKDNQDFSPPDSYKPRELEIRVEEERVKVAIGAGQTK